jgi:DNA-binding FadR family transcriptional regulator
MEFKNHHLSNVRLSDQVKDLITHAIFAGELRHGDKLPSEDRVAQDLGVSKVTVREALREMETQGLIEKRRGIYGGSFVAEPGCGKFSDLVMNYYRLGTITPEELAEFRQILEPSLIALAAERRTEEDLEAIRLNIDEFEKNLKQGNTENPFEAVDGSISVPDAPGLGVLVNEEKAARYRIDF